MKNRKAVFDRVLTYCRENDLFGSGDRVLVALSGGKDSVALLHILRKMRGVFDLDIAAVHVNHMLRGADADADEAFCRELCKQYGISLTVFREDVAALAARQKCGTEEAGREARYRLLRQTAEKGGYQKIAVAHTASDRSETVLMHLLRGAGLSGLSGILPKRETVVRPLLCLSSDDILLYAREHGLSFCEDKTNADTRYFRNYVRHTVLPVMREKNPNTENTLCRFADIAAETDAYFSSLAQKILSKHRQKDAIPLSVLADFVSSPGALAPIHALLTAWLGRPIDYESAREMIHLVQNGREGAYIYVAADRCLMIENGHLHLTAPKKDPVLLPTYPLHEGVNRLAEYAFSIEILKCRTSELCENLSQKDYTFFISSATIDTLSVRPRIDGDTYRARGQTKQVKKLLCEKKIPKNMRDRWPFVCDGEGIICSPLLPIADRAVGSNFKITFLSEDITK